MNPRTPAGFAAALSLALLAAHSLRADDEAGFVRLFDGKSLSGWRQIGGKAGSFGVENGLLVSFGNGGGWLGTDREYADYTLRLEFLLTPKSNSGIYLRAPANSSQISRTGMEIQLLDDEHPSYANLKPWQFTGSVYHVAAAERGHLKPQGEWNSIEVSVQGPHIVITLNGAKVVDDRLDAHRELESEHTGLKRKTGLIGLQSHNGRVEFKNIRIKTLPPPQAAH